MPLLRSRFRRQTWRWMPISKKPFGNIYDVYDLISRLIDDGPISEARAGVARLEGVARRSSRPSQIETAVESTGRVAIGVFQSPEGDVHLPDYFKGTDADPVQAAAISELISLAEKRACRGRIAPQNHAPNPEHRRNSRHQLADPDHGGLGGVKFWPSAVLAPAEGHDDRRPTRRPDALLRSPAADDLRHPYATTNHGHLRAAPHPPPLVSPGGCRRALERPCPRSIRGRRPPAGPPKYSPTSKRRRSSPSKNTVKS